MTYNVFGGTLNLTQSINLTAHHCALYCLIFQLLLYFVQLAKEMTRVDLTFIQQPMYTYRN